MTTATAGAAPPHDADQYEPVEGPVVDVAEEKALAAINRSEIDMQIATAKQWPRHVEKATALMKASISTPEVAAACFYVIPRGGKKIEGPGVRMAELVAVRYGNIRIGSRIVSVGQTQVKAQWAAHDLESNYATSGEVTVKITDRHGNRFSEDMINVTCLAALAKARRNAIFAIVPGTIVQDLMRQAKHMVTGGDMPIEAKREKAMSYFRKLGVDDDRILAAIERTAVEEITLDDLADLHGIATAIRDGDTTIDESFPVVGADGDAKKPTGTQKAKDLAKELKKKGKETTGVAKKPPADPEAAQQTAEKIEDLRNKAKGNEDAEAEAVVAEDRFGQLVDQVAGAASLEMGPAQEKVKAWLKSLKFAPADLADDGRWKLIFGKASKTDWTKQK